MMKPTGRADFDRVGLDGFFPAKQSIEFRLIGRARSTSGQLRTKDVGHLDRAALFTDRTGLTCGLAEVGCGSHQLGMRVTRVCFGNLAQAHGLGQGVTKKPVFHRRF